MGAYRALSGGGYVVGPLLLGFVGDLAGPAAALDLTVGLLAAVVVLFFWFAPESYRRAWRVE